MITTRVPLLLAALVAALVLGACGGDDGGGGDSDDPVAAIEKCLDDAGLETVRADDVNDLDEELVAAGATHMSIALDVNNQEYSYEVKVFSAPEKAAAHAREREADHKEMPQLKYKTESFGSNTVTYTTDSPKQDNAKSCAEDNG